jgi:hypothetical protein
MVRRFDKSTICDDLPTAPDMHRTCAGRLGVGPPSALKVATHNGVNIAARNADIGELAIAHVAEFIAGTAAIEPRTKDIDKG